MNISGTAAGEQDIAPLIVRQFDRIIAASNEEVLAPHRHPTFEIVWVTYGEAALSVDMNKVKLPSATLYCICPGQLHALQIRPGTKGYILNFTSEFIGHQDFSLMFNSKYGFLYPLNSLHSISMCPQFQPFMQATLNRMLKEIENNYALRKEVLANLLKLFLMDLSRNHRQKNIVPRHSPRSIDLVNSFAMLLEKQYSNRKTIHFYASELHVTPNYLNGIVRRVTGFTASYHVQQRVIIEAKRQAAIARKSMKEIAINLRFKDSSHFSRFFKRNVGMNFTDFRRESS